MKIIKLIEALIRTGIAELSTILASAHPVAMDTTLPRSIKR